VRLFSTAIALCLLAPAMTARAGDGRRSSMTVVTIRDDKPAAEPRRALHHPSHPPQPAAELVALNTHEDFALRPGPDGHFGRATMRAFAHFLRCHHTNRVHSISERLARLLYETSRQFDFARLEVVAGYRAPRVAREKGNPKSPHKRGLACDFRVDGVTNEVLRDYVRQFPRVGVGYYPNSGFVHLDVRDKVSAFWVDYSGPGERARYSATPDEDVRRMAEAADKSPEDPAEGTDPQSDAPSGVTPPRLPALEPSTPQDDN
jgi:uncharacterized protein YcbK (DUF882 family)